MRMYRCLWLFAILSVTGSASATEYYWKNWVYSANYSSHQAAFDAVKAYFGPTRVYTITAQTDTKTTVRVTTNTGTFVSSGDILRYGSSCPAGTTWDSTTKSCLGPAPNAGEICTPQGAQYPYIINTSGQCVPAHQADQSAQCKAAAAKGTTPQSLYVAFNSNGDPEPPPKTEFFGCEFVALSTAHCKAPAPTCHPTSGICTSSVVAKCTVMGNFTGNVAPGFGPGSGYDSPPNPEGDELNEAPCLDGPCSLPDLPVQTETKPCTYVPDSEGRMLCSSWNYTGAPGESNCGQFNGEFKCIKKPSTVDATKIDTQVETKQNADGTTTQTKTDTHTKITCTGTQCASQVTITNKTTIYNGDGTKASETGSCTGPNCGTGKNDQDGDGLDDCKVGGDCEFDGTPLSGPSLDDVPGFGASVGTFVGRVAASPIVSSVTGISVPTGGSCGFQSISTEYTGTIDAGIFCTLAPELLGALRYLFLAIWAWVAIRLLMTL